MGFQQGLSGLNATSKNLEIIGNNIANANTYGAKVARAEFSDIYASALGGTGTQPIGIGTKLAAVAQQFTQGSISTTSNPMDLAINGSGFFQVSDTEGVISYTRNGQFKVDREGYVVNNAAQRLLGYGVNGEGEIQVGIAGAIRLPTGGIEPKPTQNVLLEMNLNAGEGSTHPVSVAVELSQQTANDAEDQGVSAVMSMDDALAAMVAVTSATPEAAAALAAMNAAQASATSAAAAVASTAADYGAATQATAETNAATSQTAAETAVTSATSALTAVQAALAVEPSNGDLIKTKTLLEDAINELNTLVSDARRHTAAVDAVPAAEAGPSIEFAERDTYNSVTSLSAFDAKGQEVALTYYFQKTGIDNWSIYATANGSTVAGSDTAPQPIGTLTFSADGASLLSPLGPITFNIPASVNQAGAPTMAITGITLDLSNASQFGSPFGVTDMTQDGFAAGQLSSITVENNGVVSARYSNGLTRPAGQIEIANFRNPQGLQPMGDNAWSATFASGEPVVGVPGDGNLGKLLAGALEDSNVDITGELVSMITAQRIYQANAQTIKTIDQVMQTIVNLR